MKIIISILILLLFTWYMDILKPQKSNKIQKSQFFWSWETPDGILNIHYVEKGTGSKHIMLLHGFASYSYTWRNIIDPLVENGYHVWAIDLLGFGLSDKPEYATYGFDLFISQINEFMNAKQIPKAHFIGNSMGGGLSLGMGIFYSDRVNSLVLIDALGYPFELPYYFKIPKTVGKFGKPFMSQMIVHHILRQVVYDHKKITQDQIEAYILPFKNSGGYEAMVNTLKNFDNWKIEELSQQFRKIQVPIFIIWGDKDTLLPIEQYQNFVQDFPQADHLLIPDCGHIPQEECPEPVISAILNFYKSIEKAP